MIGKYNAKPMVQASLLAAVTIILFIVSSYIPGIGIVAAFVVPVPIVYTCIKNGMNYGSLLTAVSTLLLAILMGPMESLRFLLLSGIAGLIIGYCALKKKSGVFTLAVMSLMTLLTFGILIKALSLFLNQNILTEYINSVAQSFETAKKAVEASGLNVSKSMLDLKPDDIKNFLSNMLPGIVLIATAIVSYIIYVVTEKILRRFKINMDKIRPFSMWYVPTRVAIPLMLILLIGMFISKEEIGVFLITAQMAFSGVFILNGLCTIAYYLKEKAMLNRPITGVVVFACFMLLQPVLSIIGLVDYAINLRGLDGNRPSLSRSKK